MLEYALLGAFVACAAAAIVLPALLASGHQFKVVISAINVALSAGQ